MGLHDRPYMKADGGGWKDPGGGGGGGLTVGMPRPGKAIKVLLIINIVMFFLQMIPGVENIFWLVPAQAWQLWRFVGFQFLHGSPMHLLFNMLGLYMLGVTLERAWGARRFVVFYLTSGVFAGLCHVIMAFTFAPVLTRIPLLGASGGVYAIILACAVLFPQIRIIFLFFPVPIRFAALILFFLSSYSILASIARGQQSGISDAAHLGGMVAAAFYIWVLPRASGVRQRATEKLSQGAWKRRMDRAAAEQEEIDDILAKIHDRGLNSLSSREKKILRDATRKQQRDER